MKKFTLAAAASVLLALVSSPAEAKRYGLALSFGQDVEVLAYGGVSVRAQCIENEGGYDTFRLYAASEVNAVLRGVYDSYAGNGSYLTPMTAPTAARIAVVQAPVGQLEVNAILDAGYVFNPATNQGIAYAAETAPMGVNTPRGDCIFSIDLQVIKKFKDLT